MTERDDVAANLQAFNTDAQQFAGEVLDTMTGQQHAELVADCEQAYSLAEQLEALLGKIAVSSREYHSVLASLDQDGRLKELKNRANAIVEDSDTLNFAFSVGQLNFGVSNLAGMVLGQDGIAVKNARMVSRVEGDLGLYMRTLRAWSEATQQGVPKHANNIDNQITQWLNTH